MASEEHHLDVETHAAAQQAREFVYGTVAVLIVIAGIDISGSGQAPAAGAIIFVAAVATWLAHAYADTLGVRLAAGRPTTPAEVRRSLREASPIVAAALPATAAAAGAALGFWTLRTGLTIANILALATLAAAGWFAARSSGATRTRAVLSTVVSTSIGLGVVAVELLVHH
jgi:hypothetical protein